ncbi:MAG: hypothetical protein VYC42_09770 [Pseudomonadota bacterium]|nr:hypothetical protein [Pseudomonadota bacterium]
MAALSWDRDTAEWFTFWEEATWVCDLITKQDRKRVSFARPATIARYMLFGSAMAVASSHAVAKGFRDGILDARGLEVIEQTLVIDTDFSGKETVEFLNQIWGVERAQPLTNSIGFRLTTRDLLMKTEQEEPLLLLADYLAGLVHCALVQDPGRIRFPVDRSHAAELLRRLSAGGRLLVKDEKFNISCKALFPIVYEVFGEPPR